MRFSKKIKSFIKIFLLDEPNFPLCYFIVSDFSYRVVDMQLVKEGPVFLLIESYYPP